MLMFACLGSVVGMYTLGDWELLFWAVIVAALGLLAVAIGLAVVPILLGNRIAECPDNLYGLRKPLQVTLIVLGILELASLFTALTTLFYFVVAFALMVLVALVIERHARQAPGPEFKRRHVTAAYGFAVVLAIGAPTAAVVPGCWGMPSRNWKCPSSKSSIVKAHRTNERPARPLPDSVLGLCFPI